MANEISTAGVKIGYAVETTAGTRPTTGYINIPNIKSIGDMNPEPSNLEVTDLSDTEYKRYIPGLKDLSMVSLNANITEAFLTAWDTLVSAADTAIASSKACWFCVQIPNWSESFYFAGMPSPYGLSAIDTDAVLEGDVYIAPNQISGWAAKPTA